MAEYRDGRYAVSTAAVTINLLCMFLFLQLSSSKSLALLREYLKEKVFIQPCHIELCTGILPLFPSHILMWPIILLSIAQW